jgi:hypothetical protein
MKFAQWLVLTDKYNGAPPSAGKAGPLPLFITRGSANDTVMPLLLLMLPPPIGEDDAA